MSISIPGKVVVFDYGEVISVSPTEADRSALFELASEESRGIHEHEFWAAYAAHRDCLDEGTLGIVDYWRSIASDLGQQWSDALIHRLWLADFRSWLSIHPPTLEILLELKSGGTRLALLSNAGEDFGSYLRHGALGGLFEAVFVSGELRMLKPSPSIFHAVVDELGISPGEMIFIDNKELNVRGAESIGSLGHVFTDAAGLRTFLAALSAS